MIIRHNIASLNINNRLNSITRSQSKSTEKLASGFRVNRAADDAAGLTISEKMRSQIRGLDWAQRNALDGISLIQVTEGALNEVHSCLQKVKELSTQAANGTYMNDDKKNIQSEIDSLLGEIDHIANYTSYNNIKLLDGSCASTAVSQADKQKFTNWLNGSWLNDAAKKIENTTGWTLKANTKLSVSFESINGNAVAQMSGWYLGSDLKLTVNTNYMKPDTVYQGTDGPTLGGISSDRLITHEMVHGFMFNNVSNTAKPQSWFVEGLAEAVHGASDIRFSEPLDVDTTKLKEEFAKFDFSNSDGKPENYTLGYIATSYLYNSIESKSAGSFKTMLGEMNQTDETFEQLVVKYTGAADYSTFMTTMKTEANTDFKAFLQNKCKIDLTDGNADPLDNVDLSSSNVIPNSGSEVAPTAETTILKIGTTDVTVNWNNEPLQQVGAIVLQIGSTADQTLSMSISSSKTSDLGLNNLSIMSQDDASKSIKLCETAINKVSDMRGSLGAYQNRLEHTISNVSTTKENTVSAESRIRDIDMAREMMEYTKNNILMQAAQFLAAQASQSPNRVLELLR